MYHNFLILSFAWTSGLLPCPGYYKQCCSEHWGTRVSFNSGFLGVYAQQQDCYVVKIAARNINNLRYADDTTPMAESEEELKSFLKVKEENEKVGLKLNIQKTKIMGSGPSLHRKQMGKQWKQCQTLFFWAPKSLQMVIAAMKLKDSYSLEEKL